MEDSSTLQEEKNENVLYRKDYQEPAYWVTHADLDFQFHSESSVRVTSKLKVIRNENVQGGDLVLNGDSKRLKLVSIALLQENGDDNRVLVDGVDYELDTSDDLVVYASAIDGAPSTTLQIVVDLDPS